MRTPDLVSALVHPNDKTEGGHDRYLRDQSEALGCRLVQHTQPHAIVDSGATGPYYSRWRATAEWYFCVGQLRADSSEHLRKLEVRRGEKRSSHLGDGRESHTRVTAEWTRRRRARGYIVDYG